MLSISIIKVGQIKEPFFQEGLEEYSRRLRPYARLEVRSVRDFPLEGGRSVAREGELIQKEIQRAAPDVLVALDERGKLLSSEQLARFVERRAVEGLSRIAFVVGGTMGLAQEVLGRADLRLSLSRLTFPHQMVPLILSEQLYRSFKILRGEPYHY